MRATVESMSAVVSFPDDDEKTTLHNTEGRAGFGAQSFNLIVRAAFHLLASVPAQPRVRRGVWAGPLVGT
jgi:hypothetical protein